MFVAMITRKVDIAPTLITWRSAAWNCMLALPGLLVLSLATAKEVMATSTLRLLSDKLEMRRDGFCVFLNGLVSIDL
jgi:hypothetical protein